MGRGRGGKLKPTSPRGPPTQPTLLAAVVELKSLANPPEAVIQVLMCVCALLGENKPDWGKVKRRMTNPKAFLASLSAFDGSSATPNALKRAKTLLADPQYVEVNVIILFSVAKYVYTLRNEKLHLAET